MKSKYIMTFGFSLLVSGMIQAQQIRTISKAEVLTAVAQSNHAIKISEQEYNQAKADYKQTSAVLLPNISVSYTGITTTNPLMTFGSKLNQQILTAADFNPDLLNNPDRINNFATQIEFQQPLINMDGIYQRKAAKTKMQATELQTARTKEYMMLEVEKAYMQLQLAYSMVDVMRKANKTALANKTLAENSMKQGYLQRADMLAVEVRVTEIQNQLQSAKSNVHNASNYLSFLMNESSEIILKPSDNLEVEILSVNGVNSVPSSRSDIQAMQLASSAYENMYKADKMNFLPRLNAFGNYQFHDSKLFSPSAGGYLVGVQLSWNVFDGAKSIGKKQKSKAQYDKSQLQLAQYVSQSQMELNRANRMLQDAKNSLRLTDLAMKQSNESLRIRINRFEQGLEKTTDLLMSETQYAQKQMEYYATIFQHNYAMAYVNFLTKN